MAQQRVLIATSPGERRLVRLTGGRFVDFALERTAHPDGVDEVHLARVSAVVPALAGAFVTLGGGGIGFLPADEADAARTEGAPAQPIGAVLREGQAVAVRITRAAIGGKGARVSARIPPPAVDAARAPALLQPAPEAPQRWLAATPSPDAVVTDDPDLAHSLRATFPALAPVIGAHHDAAPLLPPWLEEAIDALAEPDVALAGGGRLSITHTPVLTAIDVDTGAAAGRTPARSMREAINRAALAEAARQVVLRNLSGNIVIDLAGLPGGRGAREALLQAAEAAFAADPLGVRVLGFSRLGLLELVRPRVHPPLAEVLGTPAQGVVLSALTHALAALRAALRALATSPGLHPRLRAAPAVIAAVRDEPAALAAFAARAGRPLVLAEDSGLAMSGWLIEDARDG